MKVQAIYNSKILKKGLEFAADNGSLFVASASLALSTVARPLVIMGTPDTDKENKKYACAKSLASSAVGYLLMLGASLPVSKAIKNIDKTPSKYLKNSTIDALKAGEKTLAKSKRYSFATQLFKLGLGFVIAVPKSIMTCALIPPFMSKIFHKQDEKKTKQQVSFTGLYNIGVESLSKRFGKIIDTKPVQRMAEKFHNTNFEQHIISLTDILATGAFIHQTAKSKGIEEKRKKALMYNAAISTGLCIAGGYALNSLLEKPTEKFIQKFSEVNKNSPKLDKYIEGIKVVKPALILGGIYYIAIPIISTFLADKFDRKNLMKEGNNELFGDKITRS